MASMSTFITLAAALSQNVALAAPVASADLAARDPITGPEIILISGTNSTIFGQDATDYDYYLTGSSLAANEAVDKLASAVSTGTEHDILVAFLNSTMAGTMTAEQAGDDAWKCQELTQSMLYEISFCANPTDAEVQGTSSTGIEKRSRWRWLRSARHVASNAAVQILYGALGNAAYANFPSSPRSWCNSANGGNACISWSNVESWNHYYAQTMVSDALSAVDFNHNSAQANGILGSRKRHAADVCISNRADGCT